MKRPLLILLLPGLLACHPATVDKQLTAEATVLGVSGDCGRPLLDFSSAQSDIEQLVGSNPYSLFYAINLDKPLQTAGTKLTVTIRKPNANEQLYCTTRGPFYQAVTIVKAAVK